MTVRTLAEAAAEVLNRTRATAPSEQMHTMPHEVVDLGGATQENPEGTDVGRITASHMGSATPPGTVPPKESKEGMKRLKGQPEDHEGHELVDPEHLNGPGVDTAGHEYAHATMEEEVEESAELSEDDLAEIREARISVMKEKMKSMGMKEDMEALFSNEDLSESFKNKASAIFEAAVIARAVTVVEELESDILAAAEESVEEIKAELEEQVDAYLNYMVEEWVNENQVAIESGLKTELQEDFMNGLKNLFTEHYIDIPEEKVDVLEAMAEEVEELQNKLNEALNNNIELSQAIVEARKSDLVTSVCEGLTATQSEKVKTLAEGVEFTTEGEYMNKLRIIRESYFNADSKKVKEVTKQIQLTESQETVVPQEISSTMERYVNALSRSLP
jgi:hypothetical protein